MTEYEKFVKQMDKLKATKPYMSEKDFNEFHGINSEEIIEPLHIKPRNHRPISSTHKNYEAQKESKVTKVKKTKEVKAPRNKKTLEEIRSDRRVRQKKSYISKRGDSYKPQLIKRISLEGMTDREKLDRKAETKRLRNKIKKDEII